MAVVISIVYNIYINCNIILVMDIVDTIILL